MGWGQLIMGLLGDIFSAIDTKKRQVRGLLDDFGGTVDMGVRRFREDQQGLQNLFANAYPMAGDKTVLNSPEQIAQFQREASDAAANMGMAAATVWHGSPHKFDKFDSSKIGTGEGAQAYGHGLYLAESPDVAKQYSKLGEIASINGMPIAGPKKAVNPDSAKALGVQPTTLDWLGNNGWNVKQAMDAAGEEAQAASTIGDKAFYHQITGDLKRLMKSNVDVGAGNVYKVDLPDEHIAKMLDYDNPLTEEVRKPLSKAALDQFGSGLTGTSGEKLYSEVVFSFKQAGHPNPTQAATDWLTKQGVPGMRYLDGGSRQVPNIANKQLAAAYAKHNGNAEEAVDDIMRGVYETPKEKAKMRSQFIKQLEMKRTSNFVVFPGNEGLLSIIERNGSPIK